jgi:hypothetical protein
MVTIKNHVTDPYTDEGEGSIKLEEYLSGFFKSNPDVDGRVDIFPSIIAFGQKENVKDVDLFIICEFHGLIINNSDHDIEVRNFACTLEMKRHGFQRIDRDGSYIWVHYLNIDENATDQSDKAKYALKNYFETNFGQSPWLYNYLWLWSLDQAAVDQLDDGDGMNLLPSTFSFQDLVLLSINQRKPFYDRGTGCYLVSSWRYDLYDDVVDLLTKKITLPEGLTYHKINNLLSMEIDRTREFLDIGKKLTIVSGRAGTGKTFTLLKYAISIAQERKSSCLILTYNKALVSDIRRLLAFMQIPSGMGPNSVQILTMDQFFFQLCCELGIVDGRISQEEFNLGYDERLRILNDNLYRLKNKPWNYAFVDEGQDWSVEQSNILISYFGAQNIVVADGVDQFIRSNQKLNWQDGGCDYDLDTRTICLRQKNNLVSFILDYCYQVGLDWSVEPMRGLGGGEVIVIAGDYDMEIHREILARCEDAHCENYDILFLVPDRAIDKSDPMNPHFKLYDDFYNAGIALYDGTNPKVRNGYPVLDGTCRLFDYESCRGLEGWAVICMAFDELIESKRQYFKVPNQSFALKSHKQLEDEYVYLWSLMPLTRAVDTLVITLSDKHGKMANLFRRLAERHPFISFIDR